MNSKGVTLIEILVVLVISLIALGALYETYITLLGSQKQQKKIAETNLQVLMALEILRKDLELAGFGLPRATSIPLNYQEASQSPASTYNTAPNDLPKPLDIGNNPYNNADYLVIRSSSANIDKKAARKWGYAYYDGSNWQIISLSSEDFEGSDYCLAFNTQKTLVNWNFNCLSFTSKDTSEIYYFIIGINDSSLRMPFNRVDYFLEKPANHPQKCHPDTYELYRSEIQHTDGSLDKQPLLDCVLNFQVVAGLDTNNDGYIDTWSKSLTTFTAQDIFNQVKEIAVYLIYQEGEKAKRSVYNNSTITITYPDNSTQSFTLPSNYQYYRWKSIEMRIKPLNLQDWKL